MAFVTLTKLTDDDREQFILDNQIAFKYGAIEEFGVRDTSMTNGKRNSTELKQRLVHFTQLMAMWLPRICGNPNGCISA